MSSEPWWRPQNRVLFKKIKLPPSFLRFIVGSLARIDEQQDPCSSVLEKELIYQRPNIPTSGFTILVELKMGMIASY